MTKVIKILGVLITIYGVVLLALGIASLLVVDMSVENFQMMRREGYPALPGVDLKTFRLVIYATAIYFIITGGLSTVSGVGVFFKRNWGRLFFLGTLILFVVGMIYTLIMSFLNQLTGERVVSNFLVLTIYIALFYFFSRGKTKELFVRNSYAA